jgi:signal peptidase II
MPTWLRPLLTVFTSCIALGLLVWLARTREKPVALTLGLVIGGALGNIIDRLRMGGVTDFLDFHVGQYHWPAFNLADSAVCMGVVILVLMSIVSPSNEKEKMK